MSKEFLVKVQATGKGVKFHDEYLTIQKGKPFTIKATFQSESVSIVDAIKFEEFHLLKYDSADKKYKGDGDADKKWKENRKKSGSNSDEFPDSFTLFRNGKKEYTFAARPQDPDPTHRLVKFKVWVIPRDGEGVPLNVDPILDERPGG